MINPLVAAAQGGNTIGLGWQAAGQVGEAIPLFERTLADRERVLGADHPHTLGSRNNLAAARQRPRG